MKTARIPLAVSLAVAALLASCAAAPVPALRPSAPLSASFRGAPAAGGETVDARWWSAFGDPVLTALVERALLDNHDIAAALERVRMARAGLDAQSSRLLPTLGVQASASRNSSGLPQAVKQGQPDTRALRLGVDLSWEIDLAGGVHAARNAAAADADAAAAAVTGARLLVSSEVARQYFLWRSAQERLAIVQALADAQRDSARLVESRFREGQASAFDLDRARAEADAFDAQLPPLRTLAGVSLSRLAVLTSANPSTPLPMPGGAGPAFAWPRTLLVTPGQPSELLQRRPDVMAAAARFAAETRRGQEARAQWWPKLFLGAVTGREDLRLNALDLAPVRYGSVALALAAPIFNAGRIDAAIQAQSAKAQQALLAWQQAVLVAVQEVEDSLLAQAQERQRAASLASTLDHRSRSLQHAQRLVRAGQIDLLALLDVQRSVLAGELALSESRLQQQLDAVQIFKALGGGYAAEALGDVRPVALAAGPQATSERTRP